MMKEITGNKTTNSGMLDVYAALKTNIMNSLKVAELGIVEDVVKMKCSLLNSPSIKILCTKLSSIEVHKGDIVLIVFTNSDFRTNLKRLESNLEPLEVTENKHSIDYGVIIGIIKENKEDASE